MSTVYLLTGILGSGKTTWAKNHINSNTFIVSKDKIREMVYGTYNYRTSDEVLIDQIAKSIIAELLNNNCNIIIDECWDTMTKGARERLISFIRKYKPGATINVKYFSSVIGNVERRLQNNYGVPKEIWQQVYNRMLVEFELPSFFTEEINIEEKNE